MPDSKKAIASKKPVAHAVDKPLDVADIARLLNVSNNNVYSLVKSGAIPSFTIGRKLIRFHQRTIDLWMQAGCPKNFSADKVSTQQTA